MQPQKKKSHTVVLLIGWLIILGSYLLIRLAFILFGLHLRSEALGVIIIAPNKRGYFSKKVPFRYGVFLTV